ncbi:MAG: c-type cytochrome [Hyphomicrobiaceae bacterium]|jgi:cytochrome c2
MRIGPLALLLIGLSASSATAQDTASIARGRVYAERICAECHAVAPGQRSPRPDAAGFAVIANTPGMTAMALAIWLQTPHREMPHIVVAPQDRDDVINYIRSLKAER